MISGLIRKDQHRLQLIGAGLGTLIGMILLLGISQFWIEMDHIIRKNRDLIDPEFLVINKKVSILETFNLKEASFSEDDIAEIRQQPWADKVEGFISNRFVLSAFADSDRFPDFYTDLFFEAVPDEFLDVKDDRWSWSKGQRTIPIILPQDYLNLYNFGFAPSQGLPQISPNTIGLVNFTVNIRGNGKKESYRGKIIGFSNRINSILVPWNFLVEANNKFGDQKADKIARLVVVSKDPTNPSIVQFLDNHGYETIREKLKSSRLNVILKFVISFLGTLGILIIILAFLVFILSFQLILAKSADKIRKLKWIGYHSLEISKPFILYFGGIIIFLALVSGAALIGLKHIFNHYLDRLELEAATHYHSLIWLGGIGLFLCLFILNSLAILRQTRKIV